MHKFIIVLIFLLSCISLKAQTFIRDSVQEIKKEPSWILKYRNKPAYYILRSSVPLFLSSAVSLTVDEQIRKTRNVHLSDFSNQFDNYLQYAPMVAMFGMKAAGLKSRSNWGEMLTADVLSAATMAGIVNGLKYTVKRKRPDNSKRNSFPSGHTATAFMAANLLYKEYADLSPWVGISAYSAASLVAIGRMLNNRHWMSDVLAGAGIGLLSSELGYFLSDIIFKKKYIKDVLGIPTDYTTIPSYFEYTLGYSCVFPHELSINGCLVSTYGGINTGISGSYHWQSGFGIGGTTTIMSANLTNHQGIVGNATLAIGPSYTKLLLPRLFLENYLYCGYTELLYNQERTHSGFGIQLGTSVLGQLTPTMGMRAYADYAYTTLPFFETGKRLNYLNLGIAVSALF